MNSATAQNRQEKEFTYFLAYSLIKRAQEQVETDKTILERLNKKCAEQMGCEPIPL